MIQELIDLRTSTQLSEMIDKTQIILTAQQLVALTYEHSASALPDIIDEYLIQLPGGEDVFAK